jgi:hypothetical protein
MRMSCNYHCKSCGEYWWKRWDETPIINFGAAWQYRRKCLKCGRLVTPYECEEIEDAV